MEAASQPNTEMSPEDIGEKVLAAAHEYAGKGWSILAVPIQTKNPGFKNWQQLRITPDTVDTYFTGNPQNLGVLLGEPSGWLIDIDLDNPRAVELAPRFLPPTEAIFGRSGKPRSHWIYRVTKPAVTSKFKSKSAGMIVEFRSTGMQTIFPPSVHESGEPIEWESPHAEPADIDPEELLAAVERLAHAVMIELGERTEDKKKKKSRETSERPNRENLRISARVQACVAAMLRLRVADNNDGSGRLYAAACRVVEHDLDDTKGLSAIREYERQRPFPRPWSNEEVLQRIRDAEFKVERGLIPRELATKGKGKVVISHDEHRVVTETISYLSADDGLFHRGGTLVRVIREPSSETVNRTAGSPTIAFVPQANLRDRMTKHVEFTQFVKRGDVLEEVVTHPTSWLVSAVEARGEWPGIRRLVGVSDVPVLRRDGSLWQTPGYDEMTSVLYEPSDEFPEVGHSVLRNDALEAVEELLDVIGDFQFEGDDHRSAWLAGLLTPLARFAFEGPAPLFLIDANVRGAGKGLLSQTIGQIVLGREMPVSSYAHDPEEMRKKVTSIAIAGDRMVLLDNLEGSFGNDTLDRALTTTRWKDRILGKSEQVDLPLISVWYGTGNNVSVASDTTRRIIHIRLDVLSDKPEERSGFKHANLIEWIRAKRPWLLTRALTILRAYFNEGMPRQNVTPFGSYEGWSRLVRESIVWLGLPDPCATRVKLAEMSDTTVDNLEQLMDAWHAAEFEGSGVVIAKLINRLYADEWPPRDEASCSLRSAIESIVGCPPGKTPTTRQLAAKLKFFRRRMVGGRYFDHCPSGPRRNGAIWSLVRVGSCP